MYYYFWFYCFKYSYCHGFFQQNMISFLCKGNRRFLKLKYTLNWMIFVFAFCVWFLFSVFCLYFVCVFGFFFLSRIFFTRVISFCLKYLFVLREWSYLGVPMIASSCNVYFSCVQIPRYHADIGPTLAYGCTVGHPLALELQRWANIGPMYV